VDAISYSCVLNAIAMKKSKPATKSRAVVRHQSRKPNRIGSKVGVS
jgi:hypothetical protein